jgi:hypothetical protein
MVKKNNNNNTNNIDLGIQNIQEAERFSSVELILNYSKGKSFILM